MNYELCGPGRKSDEKLWEPYCTERAEFSSKERRDFWGTRRQRAGKTTTLECMEGLRKYDSGKITADGRVGIQLQSASLPAFIKPMEAIQLFAKWNHTKVNNSVLSALGINELKKMKYADLSTGQKRRLHLALAVIGNPDIIFWMSLQPGLMWEEEYLCMIRLEN